MSIFKLLFIIVLAGIASVTWSTNLNVRVVGLFKNMAIVTVNGQQHTVKAGQKTPEGIVLISANSREAVLEIEGQQQTYTISTDIGSNFQIPEAVSVSIAADAQGQYLTTGAINGQPVEFLVDTGASTIAMNANQAKRLGIDFRVVGQKGSVNTASGTAAGYFITLNQVKLGGIEAKQVEAVVIDGEQPSYILLGMSFLHDLTIKKHSNLMILEKRF